MKSSSPNVHLVLFATEGFPLDSGMPVVDSANKMAHLAGDFFTSVNVYTPRGLIEKDSTWAQTLEDKTREVVCHPDFHASMPWGEAWARIGHLLWKPRLLTELVEEHDEGDIIFYHDTDCVRYPDYLVRINQWRTFVLKQLRGSDVLLFRDKKAPLTHSIKPEMLNLFDFPKSPRKLDSVWAGAIAVRCGEPASRFLKEWFRLSSDPDNLSPITNARRSPRFHVHTGEQATLSVLFHIQRKQPGSASTKIVYLRESRQIPPRGLALLLLERLSDTPYRARLRCRRLRRRFHRILVRFAIRYRLDGRTASKIDS